MLEMDVMHPIRISQKEINLATNYNSDLTLEETMEIIQSNKRPMSLNNKNSRVKNKSLHKSSRLGNKIKSMYQLSQISNGNKRTGLTIDSLVSEEFEESMEFNNSMSVKPININISTVIKSKNEELIKKIVISINSVIKPLEIIKTSIDLFNIKFENERAGFRFSLNYNDYILKPSKKDGRPKLDYPSIDFDTYIQDTQIESFSLIYKYEDLIIVRKAKCNSCLIM